jgi:hypothetical protein
MGIDKGKLEELLVPLMDNEKYLPCPKGLSKQQELAWRIQNDSVWYCEKFLKIKDKKANLVPFKFNDAQLIMERVDRYCKENNILRRYIILKARQMGMSTYTEGKMFHDTATRPFKSAMIITQEDKATQNLFNMSKLFYDELPSQLRPMKKLSNEKALSFENPTADLDEKAKNPGLRSKFTVATANTTEAGRSNTIHNLHASEVAFWSKPEITMTGLMQAIADNMETLVVLESTANGVGGYFYNIWQQAIKGENDFIPIFLPWFTDPGYTRPFETKKLKQQFIDMVNSKSADEKGAVIHTYYFNIKEQFELTYEQLHWYWYTLRNKCQNDDDIMRQEYPTTPDEAFIATGRPKFNRRSLTKYKTKVSQPIKRGYLEMKGGMVRLIPDVNGYVSIWKEPERNKFYCIGADVAEGLIAGDYSVAQVGDDEFDVVATWYGHIDPDLFGVELVKLACYFNKAYIGVENNNHGLTTLKSIQHEEYWNIYYSKQYDKLAEQLTTKMGWSTNVRTKPMMIDKLAEFIREFYLGLHDENTINELFTYIIEDNGSTNAQPGSHDDCVMSLGILLMLLLEGKGEDFVPEKPFDEEKRARRVSTSEIIDPLFEGERNKIECS